MAAAATAEGGQVPSTGGAAMPWSRLMSANIPASLMNPGHTTDALTRLPCACKLARSERVNPTRPCLVAQYGSPKAVGERPASEAMFRMWPLSPESMSGRIMRVSAIGARRFTRMVRSISSTGRVW
jgi:hypothetical protein